MNISLVVTKEFPEIELFESQIKFVSKHEKIIQALKEDNCIGYNILLDGQVVGFFLLRNYAENEYFLWDMMIDKNHQKKGLGKQSLRFLMKILHEKGATTITTTYIFGNEVSKRLLERAGFRETDVVKEEGIHEVNMLFNFL